MLLRLLTGAALAGALMVPVAGAHAQEITPDVPDVTGCQAELKSVTELSLLCNDGWTGSMWRVHSAAGFSNVGYGRPYPTDVCTVTLLGPDQELRTMEVPFWTDTPFTIRGCLYFVGATTDDPGDVDQ